MAKKEEIKGYFERVALKWNKLRLPFFDEKLRDMTIKLAGVKKGDIALDAGIGTGFMAMGAAKVVGERWKVIGIDMSEAMLYEARGNLTCDEIFGRVELIVGDLEKLPI